MINLNIYMIYKKDNIFNLGYKYSLNNQDLVKVTSKAYAQYIIGILAPCLWHHWWCKSVIKRMNDHGSLPDNLCTFNKT